jgi:tetratricopeptide (TPR) repeat protein
MVIRVKGPTGARCASRAVLVLALALGAVVLAPGRAAAAITCRAEVNRATVAKGEDVVLIVTAQGDIGWSPSFELPDLPGVRIYGGGTNQSMTVVNGVSQVMVSRTFYLRVETDAGFTIGPVRINSAAGPCQTEPIAIKVVAAGSAPPADTGNRQQRSTAGRAAAPVAGSDDVFVTLSVDKPEIWVGQQVVLSFQYWRRIQPWSNPTYTAPRTEGFWREDLGTERNFRQAHRGQAYNVTEIRYALFPTRAGRLQIEPAELSFPDDLFDRFFNSRQQSTGPRVLRTRPVTVNVRELPLPRPVGFSGIVASRCDITSSVDRQTVPRGDAIGLKLSLETDGFLKGFAGLVVTEPEGTRLHDAAENYATVPQDERLLGRLAVEKVIVTTREGTVRVPQVDVVWFDVTRGEYRTTRTPWHDVAVTPSDRPIAGGEDSGFLRNEIARVGDDLAFIHAGPLRGRGGLPATGGPLWWALAGLPVALLAAWRWWLGRLDAERRDPAGRRRRGAMAAARGVLRSIDGRGDEHEGLATAARAVTAYVGDCLDRSAAAIGSAEVAELAALRGRPDLGAALIDLLDRCDQARFGGRAAATSATLSAEALALLSDLEKGGQSGSGRTTGRAAGAHVVLFFAMLAGLAAVSSETRAAADPAALVAQGNQAYTDGRFTEARDFYLQARALGLEDPTLHYNLGNAQARVGEVGPAVASYLRAQRLAPRDRDVHRNLAWLRQNLKDLELANQKLPLFVAQGAALVGALSLDEWGLLLVISIWLLAAVLGWGWARGITPAHRRVLLTAAGTALLLAAVTGGRWHQERVRDQAVVVAAAVEVRSGPASTFPTLFEVHAGLALNVEGRRDGWAMVSLGGDWQGWLPVDAIEQVRLQSEAVRLAQASGR